MKKLSDSEWYSDVAAWRHRVMRLVRPPGQERTQAMWSVVHSEVSGRYEDVVAIKENLCHVLCRNSSGEGASVPLRRT